jgi:D-alanyl-D-alanine carboxypeptidase (penicillin-binding protein 5/6)
LLKLGIGADGLKTGHTEEAGYGIVGSANLGTRRIVFVVTGLESAADRARESEQLVNWAFRQFVEKKVASAGEEIARARIWMGDADDVGLVVAADTTVLLPALAQNGLDAQAIYFDPIEAPVQAGTELGQLVIKRGELPDTRIPLVADRSVERGGFVSRLQAASQILMGKLRAQVGGFF